MAKTAFHRELERKSNDLLRVYNPTDEDYVVEWDRKEGAKLFRVRSKTEEVLPRYIANKYIREMYQKIVTDDVQSKITKENERRAKAGMSKMNKWEDQPVFEGPLWNKSSEHIKEITSILYVGIERQYGVDDLATKDEPKPITKPAFEQALDEVQTEKDREPESNQRPSDSKASYSCDFPGCDFTTTHKVALISHQRTHEPKDDSLEAKKAEAAKGVSK